MLSCTSKKERHNLASSRELTKLCGEGNRMQLDVSLGSHLVPSRPDLTGVVVVPSHHQESERPAVSHACAGDPADTVPE